jgi:hypothetical protein
MIVFYPYTRKKLAKVSPVNKDIMEKEMCQPLGELPHA